jgi:hypothetical protein
MKQRCFIGSGVQAGAGGGAGGAAADDSDDDEVPELVENFDEGS